MPEVHLSHGMPAQPVHHLDRCPAFLRTAFISHATHIDSHCTPPAHASQHVKFVVEQPQSTMSYLIYPQAILRTAICSHFPQSRRNDSCSREPLTSPGPSHTFVGTLQLGISVESLPSGSTHGGGHQWW